MVDSNRTGLETDRRPVRLTWKLLQFLTGWIASDPARLAPSLLAFVGHPAYGLDTLRSDLDRFTFLLGGSDGEDLFGQP